MSHGVNQHRRLDYSRTTGVPLINESSRYDCYLSVHEPDASTNVLVTTGTSAFTGAQKDPVMMQSHRRASTSSRAPVQYEIVREVGKYSRKFFISIPPKSNINE
jgi:hypothetical protein